MILVLTLLWCCLVTTTSRAQPSNAPVYARQRDYARAEGFWNNGSQYLAPYPGYYPGYAPYQPAFAGSWYARPYPYHFDYYRGRFSAPAQKNDCPCAKTTTGE
ncbi:MAG: hypothetical protein GXP24_09560 [Planctomycetes bacterium]|nr:hypothetical protein [Planctomycetota bacterium]